MQMTRTGRIAREVISKTGRGTAVFNDMLVDGDRSLKVWGWLQSDYDMAKELLEAEGCVVFQHRFQSRYGTFKLKRVRLHITEPIV